MGSKIEAKRLMAAAGVPVLRRARPGAVDRGRPAGAGQGAAGGGGRGMRVVRDLDELAGEVEPARGRGRLARSATAPCSASRTSSTGRHVEVQVMADTARHRAGRSASASARSSAGTRRWSRRRRRRSSSASTACASGCSTPPAPRPRRSATSARAPSSSSPTTTGRFFFLEMNTRLQVEHPVTECVTGLDLVALQIAVAEGGRARPPSRRRARGHAIEVRLYAEDPAADWQPQTGTLHRFAVPGVAPSSRPRDARASGWTAASTDGSVVGMHYDPMLAKVICWAPTRDAGGAPRWPARSPARGSTACVTNRDLLVSVLRHPAFLAGDTDTAFFDRHGLDALAAPLADERPRAAVRPGRRAGAGRSGRRRRRCWRRMPVRLAQRGQPRRSATSILRRRARGRGTGSTRATALAVDGLDDVGSVDAAPTAVVLDVDGVRRGRFEVAALRRRTVYVDSAARSRARCGACRASPTRPSRSRAGSLLAPMPGTVVAARGRARRPRRAPAQPMLVAGGDEDGAPDRRARRRRRRPSCRVAAGQQVDVGAVLPSCTERQSEMSRRHELHRDRGAAGAAQGGRRARRALRPRVLHARRRAGRRAHRPSCGPRPASSATSASTCPRSTAAAAAASDELAIVCEELAAAGCRC